MSGVTCRAAALKMRKAHGECYHEVCAFCCNMQKRSTEDQTQICIAYGENTPWNREERACGLFNVPFRGLRPRQIPLSEIAEKSRMRNHTAPNEKQMTMFPQTLYPQGVTAYD